MEPNETHSDKNLFQIPQLRNFWHLHVFFSFNFFKKNQFSAPDNGRFVSVGGDKMVFVWDVTTGKTIRKFEGHTSRINTCAWNSDCSILASGSYDTTLRLWDCKSGSNHCVEEIKGFRDSVSKVVIKDYQIIASSIDGSIRSFDVRMGEITIDEFLRIFSNFFFFFF